MMRLSTPVALALTLVIGLQMAACLSSGDCLQFHMGCNAVSGGPSI